MTGPGIVDSVWLQREWEPVIFEAPTTEGCFYTMLIMDATEEALAILGKQTHGTNGATIVLASTRNICQL